MNLIHHLTLQLRFPQGSSVEEINAVTDTCYDDYFKKAVEDTLERLGERYAIEAESLQIDLGVLALEDIPSVLPERLEKELLKYCKPEVPIDEGDGLVKDVQSEREEVFPDEIRTFMEMETSAWPSEAAPEKMRTFLAYLWDERIPWQTEVRDFNPQSLAEECMLFVFTNAGICRAFSRFLQAYPQARVRFRDLWGDFLFSALSGTSSENVFPALQTTASNPSGSIPWLSFEEVCERDEIREMMEEGCKIWSSEAASEKMRTFLTYLWDGRIPWQTETQDFNPQTRAEECIPLVFADARICRAFSRFLQAFPQACMRCRDLWGETLFSVLSEASSAKVFPALQTTESNTSGAIPWLSFEERYERDEILQETLTTEEIFSGFCPEKEKEKLWVDDAGIVLLHPFFNTLFHRLELLDEKSRFKNTSSVERAVHLLKYLADTISSHFSHQLNLEKILCGLPCHYPMRHRFEVTEKEKDEVSQVLKAACDYWKPLNGTSEEGFRQSFLRRSGEMEYADQSWLLKVEGMAVDILMDDLPWEISVITLPWMKDPLMVDWQWNY